MVAGVCVCAFRSGKTVNDPGNKNCRMVPREIVMQRMGMMIGLKSEKVEEYKRLHSAVWPEILSKIRECNITNYSIFLKEPENYLFGYWEYVGEDFELDMKTMADDPRTREWWDVCGPCQVPVSNRKEGEWWAMMEQVFYID